MEYPFNEGDTYYTLEALPVNEIELLKANGENPYLFRVVESCWDDISEEMHYETMNYKGGYFKTREEAEAKNYTLEELNEYLLGN